MGWIELLFLAGSLAMDAFAVSISNGILIGCANRRLTLRIAGAFGIFQGLMPMIGYLVAGLFATQIKAIDHWVAFALLAFIGGKMLWEVFFEGEEEHHGDPRSWKVLFLMSIATSIDAMAAGVTMALDRTELLAPWYGYLLCCGVITLVTFVFCLFGVQLGCRTGNRYGKYAEIAGGVVLIGLGVKILLEHLLGA